LILLSIDKRSAKIHQETFGVMVQNKVARFLWLTLYISLCSFYTCGIIVVIIITTRNVLRSPTLTTVVR